MSQTGAASTARQDPSLIAISSMIPRSISTMVSLTFPASKQRAAPWVRLTQPEATAASVLAVAADRRGGGGGRARGHPAGGQVGGGGREPPAGAGQVQRGRPAVGIPLVGDQALVAGAGDAALVVAEPVAHLARI